MSNSIGLGNELQVVDPATGNKRWVFRFQEDGDIDLVRFNSSGVEQETVMSIDGTTGATTGLGRNANVVQAIANDVIPTIIASTRGIVLADTTTGNKAILTDTSGVNAVQIGQVVDIRLVAATGNSYTLALAVGTLTLNAAAETATIIRTAAGWEVISLSGATIV